MKIIFILLIFKLTKDINMLPLTISFAMYLLYSSIFSTTSTNNILSKYQNNKNHYERYIIFKYSIIMVIIVGIVLLFIAYYIGNILNIDKMNIINVFMTLAVISNVIVNIIKEYLGIIGYKKISNNIIDIYNLLTLTINVILSILLFKVFNINNYIYFIVIYLINITGLIILSLILYLLLKNKKKKRIRLKLNLE